MLRPPSSFSMTSFRASLLRVVAIVSLSGCADAHDRARDSAPDGHVDQGDSVVATAPRPVSGAEDTLRLRLDVPREVRGGAAVPFAFHVENVAGRPLTLYLQGRAIAFDVVVRDASGRTVWR